MSRGDIEYLDGKIAVVQIANKPKSRPAVVRLKWKKDAWIGVVQNSTAGTVPTTIEVAAEDILSVHPNLGVRDSDTAYGVRVEPWMKLIKTNHWGPVNFFRETRESEDKAIQKAFSNSFDFLKAKKLHRLALPINVQIRPNTGAMMGFYQPHAKDPTEDMICLCPKEFDAKEDAVTLLHEYCHVIWKRYFTHKEKALWVELYKSGAAISSFSKEEVAECRKDFVNSDMMTTEYLKSLEGKNQHLFKACLQHIQKNYKLNARLLDVLRYDGADLKSYWPKSPLDYSEMSGLVNKYSGKSPEELCCEGFAFWCSKQDVPEPVKEVIKKTIKPLGKK